MTYSLSTQKNIDFKVTVEGLGPDALLLQTLEGEEAISEPFTYRAVLQSPENTLDVQNCIGKNITIEVKIGQATRHVHGVIGRMKLLSTRLGKEPQGRAFYQVEFFPKFWTLKFSSECRIFQHKKALDIIKQVLKEGGVTLQDKTIDPGFEPLPYCVQYNESHYDFVCRLMESIGVFYFFTFSASGHTMVLGNDASAHPPCPSEVKVAMDLSAVDDLHKVRSAQLQAQMVSGGFSHVDYDYKKPSTSLKGAANGSGKAIKGKLYEYPGDFLVGGSGSSLANIHLQEAESLKVTLEGASSAPFFTAGHKFTLAKSERTDLNAGYILNRVVHRWQFEGRDDEAGVGTGADDFYSNTYQAFPEAITFRPARITPRPRIHGTQTAVVTGKSGEEIWTDKYGRIKVKFHWDHLGTSDEKSSCWIRVSQGWASSGWGILFTPRIGMEVVVSFICGDPDRPLVTGVVYNGEHLPPYLPAEPTKSTIYTHSSKGGGGYNEIRFEDKKDKEEIYMHAQKDMNIDVLHDRNTKIHKGHEILEVQKGFRTTTIKKDDKKTIEDGDEIMTVAKGNYKRKVKGNYTMEIGGNLKIKVGGDIIIEGAKNYKLKAGMNIETKSGMNTQMEAGLNLMAKGGVNVVIKAGAMGQVEAGAIQIIKGALVKIN
jgi:type VI secretion system secreted protein VgrG